MKTGGTDRIIAQTGLDSAYQQFMRQQNWASDRLQPLLQVLGKGGSSAAPQSNAANSILGLGSTIAGIWGGGGFKTGGGGLSASDQANLSSSVQSGTYDAINSMNNQQGTTDMSLPGIDG